MHTGKWSLIIIIKRTHQKTALKLQQLNLDTGCNQRCDQRQSLDHISDLMCLAVAGILGTQLEHERSETGAM